MIRPSKKCYAASVCKEIDNPADQSVLHTVGLLHRMISMPAGKNITVVNCQTSLLFSVFCLCDPRLSFLLSFLQLFRAQKRWLAQVSIPASTMILRAAVCMRVPVMGKRLGVSAMELVYTMVYDLDFRSGHKFQGMGW